MMRHPYLLVLGILGLATGCVSVKTPDVSVDVSDPVSAWHKNSSSSSKTEAAPRTRYTPYAKTLDRVIRQQTRVNGKYAKRDWKDLDEEADKWVADVRTLSGYANASHNPDRYRTYSAQLLEAVQEVKRASRDRDADKCGKALDQADKLLDQFTKYFPQTEPIESKAAEQPAGSGKVP
jgi:hypothetical protein